MVQAYVPSTTAGNEAAQATNYFAQAARQALAYNALSKMYGPIAGDPKDALAMSQYAQEQQMNPLLLEEQRLKNAQEQEANREQPQAFQSAQALKGAQTGYYGAETQRTNAEAAQVAPNAAAQRASEYASAANARAAAAHTAAETGVLNRGQQLNQAAALLANLKTARDNAVAAGAQDGGRTALIQAYKQNAPALQSLGVDPAHVAPLAQALMQNPGLIEGMQNQVTAQIAAQNGGMMLTPDAIKGAAETYQQTGQLPNLGYGKAGAAAREMVVNAAYPYGSTQNLPSNWQTYKSRQSYLTDLTKSTPNSAGGKVRSASAAVAHLMLLSNYVQALNNGNTQASNALGQEINQQFGVAAPQQFDAQKRIVADEVTRYLIGTGGGVADREALAADLSRANSPQQLQGVIDTYIKDMTGQLAAQQQQAQSWGADQQFQSQLTPQAAHLLQLHQGGQQQAQPQFTPQQIVDELRRRGVVK